MYATKIGVECATIAGKKECNFLLTCCAKCATRREGIVKWQDFQNQVQQILDIAE